MEKRKPGDLIFKLDHQFTLYLQRVGLSRETMAPDQLRETKRAFFGGLSQMFIMCTQTITTLNLDEKNEFITTTARQITAFWMQETGGKAGE